MDNQPALAYSTKMGGTVNQKMNQVSRELWKFLKGNGIRITLEHLLRKPNTLVDKESRKKTQQ